MLRSCDPSWDRPVQVSWSRSVRERSTAPAWDPLVGLIRSLSAHLGRDPSQSCRAVCSSRPASCARTLYRMEALLMLADQVAFVIGVDTHRDTHELAVVDARGRVIQTTRQAATQAGYRRMLAEGMHLAPGVRIWAVEGSGSYGRGLVRLLHERGERVVEIDRPSRRDTRSVRKDDRLDAIRAAGEALRREHLAAPRAAGDREALRVLYSTREAAIAVRRAGLNQLRALVVCAPSPIRYELRRLSRGPLLARCAALAVRTSVPPELHATRLALRATAQRVLVATDEAAILEKEILALVSRLAPALLAEHGVGPISAAQILIAWSHPGRIRSEAAFAALAGVSPIPASSGQTVRYRLNRGGG